MSLSRMRATDSLNSDEAADCGGLLGPVKPISRFDRRRLPHVFGVIFEDSESALAHIKGLLSPGRIEAHRPQSGKDILLPLNDSAAIPDVALGNLQSLRIEHGQLP